MDRRQFTLLAGAAAVAGLPGLAHADTALDQIIAGAHRKPADRARDPYRHPAQTLGFFGLARGMNVIELAPSSYYFDILAPYAKATGGAYLAAGASSTTFAAELQNGALYGTPGFAPAFGAVASPRIPPASVDLVLTFRNVHNWLWTPGLAEQIFKEAAAVLKTGGVLGVVEHRADPRPEANVGGRRASDGYVAKATIVALGRQAGLRLAAESQINANPKDTKDHPFGVWTLPPNNRATPPLPADWNPDKYKAIGESDRMTLKFVKA